MDAALKKLNKFLEDEKRQESKEVDELTSYKYGERRKIDGKNSVSAQN